MIKKCEHCDAKYFEGKTEPFHDICCPLNKLTYDEWHEKSKENTKKIFEMLMQIGEQTNKAYLMTYSELADYIVNSEFYRKTKINTMDGAVLDRILDILYRLPTKEKYE